MDYPVLLLSAKNRSWYIYTTYTHDHLWTAYEITFFLFLSLSLHPQDLLNDLPRPHSLVLDEEFLQYYSLQAQQLTLKDVLGECGLPE